MQTLGRSKNCSCAVDIGLITLTKGDRVGETVTIDEHAGTVSVAW